MNRIPAAVGLVALAGLTLGLVGCGSGEGPTTAPIEARGKTPTSPAPGRAIRAGSGGPQVWAVVAGIDRYEDPAIRDCRGAVRDAAAVRDWIVRKARWGEDHVLLMTDSGAAAPAGGTGAVRDLRPTRENLNWAIREWLGRRVRPGDLALIYFAGQAVALPGGGEVGGGPREFLLPIDARLAFLDATGWSPGDALDPLAGANTGPILCLLDTSPRGRGRSVVPAGDDPTLGARMMKNIARWPGVAVWLAADDRPADDGDGEAGGPFASAFLRALESPGRRNTLLACLGVLGDDPTLAAQGFRTLGGLPSGATLWPEDRRNPRIADPGLVLQRGHAAAVRAIAFNADGSLMASGAEDSTIRLWRARDRTLLRVLPYHANGVSCLAISPDGRLLASGDGMGAIRAWDLVEDEPMALGDPSPHVGNIVAVGFMPDGRGLISADADGRWALWDLSGPTARLVRLPDASTRAGRRPAFARQPGAVAAAVVLAAPGGDDRIGLFRPDRGGGAMAVEAGPGGAIERLALSADGRRLAIATEGGLVEVRDFDRDPVRPPRPFAAPIGALELVAGRLVVQSAEGLHVLAVGVEGGGERHDIEVEEEIDRFVVSSNGRRIAAVTGGGGDVLAWELDAATGVPRPLPLAGSAGGGALTPAFRPDGAALAVGDSDGGIRVWDLPEGSRQPVIRPYRGQVVHVAASPDKVHLLQVTRDGVAKVWDLEGCGLPVTLEGGFRPSGAFLPGGEGVVLLDEAGDVVIHGLDGDRRGDVRFEPPPVPGRDAAEGDFRTVAVSPDGRLVAAGGAEEPLVCIWEIKGGRARDELRKPHVERILVVQFSGDGRHLLTASEGEAGVVAVWDLRAGTDEPHRVIPPQDRLPLTGAAMSPVDPSRIAVARRDGRASVVELWGPGVGDLRRLGQVEGEIAALAFSASGEHLAAAGWEKLLYLWSTGPPPAALTIRARPQHDERINTVAAWPGAPLFVTGSDDTTMRFWRVDRASGEGRALGTLVAGQGSPDWVAYTPDGLFDGSPDGVELVTMRAGGDVARLDQCYDLGHLAHLTDYLRRAELPPRPRAVAGEPPPQLALDLAAPASGREVELVLRLGPGELRELRLYHNGSVIGGDLDEDLGDGRRSVRIKATLAGGPNRFFAMGGRGGSIDGRSNLVEIAYDHATEPGNVHVLALGVGKHRQEEFRLQFAAEDAKAISAFLRERGINGDAGASGSDLLLDDEVSPRSLDEAFARIQARVAGRPQDTIIVFLAGHSGVRGDRLGLLLSRGPAAGPPEVLPYGEVLRNLAYLDALKRLVIIDACDAGAILEDTAVLKARRGADRDLRRARTSYLLAARRGEVANEVEQLRHGLLTYVLLRGMGADGLEDVPDLAVFREHQNADFDHDDRIDTVELRRYADLTLAPLAAHYPKLVSRGRPGPGGPRAATTPAQHLRTQEVTAPPFPLVQIPGAKP